jgi:predicted cobalt transporter CbtA
MSTVSHKSITVVPFLATALEVLHLVPKATQAQYNTATGSDALDHNTGSYNTADGYSALFYNTTGWFNTAVGYQSLNDNTTGY